MKKHVLLCLFGLFGTLFLTAQDDCRPYMPAEEGNSWELTSYSPKGKVDGVIRYELLQKEVNGQNVTFTVRTQTLDKNEEELYISEFQAFCKDGEFSFDMAFKMDGASMSGYQNMGVDVDAGDYPMPDLEAAAGTSLPDGQLRVNISTGGPINMGMTVSITDRLIEGKETITTPAGTFDCVVLSQTVSTKLVMKVEGRSKEWYAPGIGMVRSESYNRKGKLTGYSELTALEN